MTKQKKKTRKVYFGHVLGHFLPIYGQTRIFPENPTMLIFSVPRFL